MIQTLPACIYQASHSTALKADNEKAPAFHCEMYQWL